MVMTALFLHVEPEHVVSITHSRPPSLPRELTARAPAQLAQRSLVCWTFSPSQPSSLIAQRGQTITPWSNQDAQIWDSLRRLSRCLTLVLYFDTAAHVQSAPALSSLCRAASSGTPLRSTSGHLDLDSLYLSTWATAAYVWISKRKTVRRWSLARHRCPGCNDARSQGETTRLQALRLMMSLTPVCPLLLCPNWPESEHEPPL